MGKIGKRTRAKMEREREEEREIQRRRGVDVDEKSKDELVVYRILCPAGFIGCVIGKSGKVINLIRQETRAKVKVVDPFPGAKDRVITIYCNIKEKKDVDLDEEFNVNEPLCPAQDALLKVHAAIANAIALAGDSDKKQQREKEECHILVPSSQSASIIGKSGAIIKKLRSTTKANIKVTAKDSSDPAQSCALGFDNFLMINGDPEAVKKALYAVSAIMYKFSPKEDIPLETSVPEAPPSIIIPSDVPIYHAGGLYPPVDSLDPSRSFPPVMGSGHVPELQGYTDPANTWQVYSSGLPVVSGYGGMSQSEELVIRVLCLYSKIGRVIGKGGSSIKSVRQGSGARVDVDDTKADRHECVITITATESLDDLKSMAVEAVLLLQEKINEDDEDIVAIRLLVSSKVIGCIIGKSGSVINEIRKKTRADVRISKDDKPKCADANDELVEVAGEVTSVRDALIQIVLRLRDDVLKDRDGGYNPSSGAESVYSGGSARQVPSMLPSVPQVAPMGYEPRAESASGLGLLSSSYRYGSVQMGDRGYGSLPSYSSKFYEGDRLPPSSTLEMAVPAYAVGKVMGKGGSNIDNIRKISGAAVDIFDSISSRGDFVALISGTPEQKRAAENLIQAFIMAT